MNENDDNFPMPDDVAEEIKLFFASERQIMRGAPVKVDMSKVTLEELAKMRSIDIFAEGNGG